MALSRVKVWVPGEVLTAADLNGEFNNILNNPVSLISPLTANVNANGKQITNLALENLSASPSAATVGRIWFNTASTVKQVEVDDGTSIRAVPSIKATDMAPGDIIYAIAATSSASGPSWARLAAVTSSQAGGVPLVQTTSAPRWGNNYAQAWCVFNGSATSSGLTILDGAGVSSSANSITQVSSGQYIIPWVTPFANTNYSLSVTANFDGAVRIADSVSFVSSEAVIVVSNTAGAAERSARISILAVGRI